ncbi:MAG: DNA-binding domain-containing protein [Arenimonas sp.]
MNALAAQAAFADCLRRQTREPGQGTDSPLSGIDAARLAIHRNNFVATLVDALAEAFPVTQALAGTEFFREMARHRVRTDPPQSPVIAEYASGFPHFVGSHAAAADVPFLASVARLEGLCLESFHSLDATPIPLEAFQALLQEPSRFVRTGVRIHPAARWMRSRYAVHTLWAKHQDLADMSAARLGGIDPRRPEAVLVARPALDVVVALLPPGGFTFLDSLSAGLSLQSAITEALRDTDDAKPTMLFSVLVRYGLAIELLDIPQEHP